MLHSSTDGQGLPPVPELARTQMPVLESDSEDEDECEDLFSGTWDPEIAAKRRARKVSRRDQKTAKSL